MLCRYHNLDGAESLCGKKGIEKIMQRIHSIQYNPLNVVARNADLVLQARVKDYSESVLYDLLYKEHKLIDGFDKEMCIYDTKDFARFQFVRNEYEWTVDFGDTLTAMNVYAHATREAKRTSARLLDKVAGND